jgi:fatty acid desaturase
MSEASSAPDRSAEVSARRQVRKLREFYQLCLTAVFVIALTGVVNALTAPGHWWSLWVVFGFAVAIAFSALDTFGRGLWLGRDWEERKVRELLGRDR